MRLSKQTPFVQPQATYVFVSGNFLFKILYSKQPCTYYLGLRNRGQKLLLAQCTNMTWLKTFRLLCLKSDKNKTMGTGESVRLAALKKKQRFPQLSAPPACSANSSTHTWRRGAHFTSCSCAAVFELRSQGKLRNQFQAQRKLAKVGSKSNVEAQHQKNSCCTGGKGRQAGCY